ncbi:cleavage polyadenylation factor subunit [Martiniozyma asiatica (nom. inval.)]|nr:cleavage polyadenylation factor subunit [Martiniozyma asiatica]
MAEQLFFHCLGGGNEVGRSCHVIEYGGKVVMLDAGVHPAYAGLESLPFYDDYDLSKVDILLISHFHLDHAASLPYVMQHTTFKGRVFMTYPTKAIYKWLLNDFVRVTSITDDESGEGSSFLYTDEDLSASLDKIEAIDYHSTIDVDGVRFTAYHAGHVLGAAMFLIEMGGVKVMFTGDYSREEDRHLSSAEVPPVRPDLLITESTFGTATHIPRLQREEKLTNLIHSTINGGGRCLLPVFALGRAQEILLILDEYWEAHPELQKYPIYYASDLAKKCMAVYQRYIYMMNNQIKKKFSETNVNPFVFKFIKNITHMDKMNDSEPCVIIASPGMLQNGISRKVLEKWSPDGRNAVIMTGYSIEGTMAKQLLTEPSEIPSIANPDISIPRKINVEEISFAAHVDYEQNSEFIEKVNPKSIILVHGESNPMGRLKSALLSKYQKLKNTEEEVRIFNPRNSTTLALEFKTQKVAKVVGEYAKQLPKDGENFKGVLVQRNFDINVMKVDDVKEFTTLSTTVVKQKQTVRCNANRALVRWQLSQMFGEVKVITDTTEEFEFDIMNCVRIILDDSKGIAAIHWESGINEDTIADSVIAILLTCDSSPASVKLTSKSCSHAHSHSEIKQEITVKKETNVGLSDELFDSLPIMNIDTTPETRMKHIVEILTTQFGEAYEHQPSNNKGIIKIGKNEAVVDYNNMSVECKSNVLRGRVENVLTYAKDLVSPLKL